MAMWKRLNKLALYQWLVLLAPIVMWFSYYPKISLLSDATTNYELSLPIIYLVVLALAGVPSVIRNWRNIMKNPLVIIGGLFVGWSLLTLLWTVNKSRGVMVVGLTGVLWLVLCGILAQWRSIYRIRKILLTLFINSAVVVAGLTIIQAIAGIWVVRAGDLMLCPGCIASQFGFVRPNLFAIEPQFLGNLLLAPLLILVWQLTIKSTWQRMVKLLVIVTALILTLSRGAIIAGIISCGIVLALQVKVLSWSRFGSLFAVGVIGVVLALLIQGISAQLSPYVNETFGGAIAKSINHLSLGKVKLYGGRGKAPVQNKRDDQGGVAKPVQPTFAGYVAESTDIRINLSKVATMEWSKLDWPHKMIGVGVGSAGVVMAPHFGGYAKEIVQNEYVEVLLERGIVGFGLLVGIIVVIARVFWKREKYRWLLSILVAYLVQYCFYSGLPNSLHVFVVLIFLYGAATSQHLPRRFD